jgi:plasminogen activator
MQRRRLRDPARAAICSAVLLAAAPQPLLAADLGLRESVFYDAGDGFKIEAEISAGHMQATSHELVYDADTGRKVSELIWTMDDVAVIGGKLSFQPTRWWSFDVGGFINATETATMDDYDWLDEGTSNWTHWSHHEDTDLKAMQMFDFSSKLALWRSEALDVKALAGYRFDNFEWVARGGTYIYSSDTGFRDLVGDFPPGVAGITYRQEFNTPYLGASGQLRLGPVTIDATVAGSVWVGGQDHDQHHFRGLVFKEDFEGGQMLKVDVEGRYQMTDELALKVAWQHLDYERMKGPTKITSPGFSGSVTYPGDSAGADHQSDIISGGLVYTFN